MMALRLEAQQSLRVYMSRTQLSLREIAGQIGFAHRSLIQFCSAARYGDGQGNVTAQTVLAWLRDNPAPLPELPGKLYPTTATHDMDRLLAYICRGRWGTLYGPAGAQKTFLLEFRSAEAAREPEPRVIYIRCSPSGMSPPVLLGRIAAALGAPYAQSTETIRRNVLYTIRRRKAVAGIVLDEAQHLYPRIDTLETLRELGDLAAQRVGILVAGNEDVLRLFEPRKRVHFEQWRSRIQQRELRVLGPTREEARQIVASEFPQASSSQVEGVIEGCTVADPVEKKKYVNARRLFNTLRDMQELRGMRPN